MKAQVRLVVMTALTIEADTPEQLLERVQGFQKLPYFPDKTAVSIKTPNFEWTDDSAVVQSVQTEFEKE